MAVIVTGALVASVTCAVNMPSALTVAKLSSDDDHSTVLYVELSGAMTVSRCRVSPPYSSSAVALIVIVSASTRSLEILP